MPTIAVDAMGARAAPRVAVEAVAEVSLTRDVQCVLVGPEDDLQSILEDLSYNAANIDIVGARDVIAIDEDAARALRHGRNTSLTVAARLVAEGAADALVTAGNAAAALRVCRQEWTRLEGIAEVAVAGVFPHAVERGDQSPLAMILDVGATVHCAARDLATFAILGAAYARAALGARDPHVGLLNVESREGAGGAELAHAHALLRRVPELSFAGNVEGHELAAGRTDVIVCEGLVGNVVLKMLHEFAGMAVDHSGEGRARGWRRRAGLAVLGGGAERRPLLEYESYAGAPLLGFERVAVLCHPQAKVRALGNAIDAAANAVRHEMITEVRTSLLRSAVRR